MSEAHEEMAYLETVIELTTVNGVRVVTVGNEVDIANAAVLQRYLNDAADGVETFIVSLAGCRYMDSTGLRPIMRLADRMGEGFFIVVPPRTQIRRIFELTRMHEQMQVCDTLEAALDLAGANAPGV